MIKVTALTSGKNDASRRFRVRQFIRPLHQLGIQVSEHRLFVSKYELPPRPWLRPAWGIGKLLGRVPGLAASRFADITWLERELFPGRFTLERLAGSKRLLDIDDAIWLAGKPNFSEEIAARCFGVIAGNQFIADHYQKHSDRVWVVPTSVDTDRWRPAPDNEKAGWTIGWTGTKSNLEYLYVIEEALADFLAQHADSRLLILCDEKPVFNKIAAARWRFERWSSEKEVQVIQQMNVGLMPLPDMEWTRGKCSLKMLLYMAVGIPVVASPVGHNKEVLQWNEVGFAANTANDWYEALSSLFNDRDLAARLGNAGREVVTERYSVHVNAVALARIFREVAGG
jgi:glycosyltransferase involved in cell wall biosynthesis